MPITRVERSDCQMSIVYSAGHHIPLQDLLCDLERAVIDDVMKIHGGIKARAADQLMLNRTTLVEKCRKYGFPLKKND